MGVYIDYCSLYLTRNLCSCRRDPSLLPGVRSQMCCQMTLPTRPILAKVARVRLLPRVRSQMFCQFTLPSRPILAEVARIRLNFSFFACTSSISAAPLPLHAIDRFPNSRHTHLLPSPLIGYKVVCLIRLSVDCALVVVVAVRRRCSRG